MKRRIAYVSTQTSQRMSAIDADGALKCGYVSELSPQLVCLGYEIDIFIPKEDAEHDGILCCGPGIRVIFINSGPADPVKRDLTPGYTDEFCFNVIDFIKKQKLNYDLVHADCFLSALVAIKLRKKFNLPFIVDFNDLRDGPDSESEQNRPIRGQSTMEKQIAGKAEAIVAVSAHDKNDLSRLHHVKPDKIFIIPQGLNERKYFPVDKNEARAFLQISIEEKIVLHAGSLDRHSAAEDIVKAMALLHVETKQIRLLILISTPSESASEVDIELGRLNIIAVDLGISNQITVIRLAELETLNYYYSAADVVVTAPGGVPFDNSLVEAMACGTPVIEMHKEGAKFDVVDGRTGFLVPPQQPAALADRIGLVIGNEALLHQMGKAALLYANTSFTWEVIAGHIDRLYQYVLMRHRHRNADVQPVGVNLESHEVPRRNIYLRRNTERRYGS